MDRELKHRSGGQPPGVFAYCWKLQLRLHSRFKRVANKGNSNISAVATTRELADHVWGPDDRKNVTLKRASIGHFFGNTETPWSLRIRADQPAAAP